MKELINDNPFIKDLSKSAVKNLIIDNELRKDNVVIYFVVDTYDIIEYCFPFHSDGQKEEYELKTKLIAYDYLFYENENKPLVPDEYLAELNSFMYHLKNKANNAINAFKDIENLFKEKEQQLDFDFFTKNITTFLAIQYDLLNPVSLDRYRDIFSKRLDAFNITVKNKNDRETLSNLFAGVEKSDLTEKIFEDYYDNVKLKFIEKKPTSEKIFRHLNNTYKDIVVIDRLIQINNILEKKHKENKLEKKYLFLYVSSTPSKSKVLFKLPSLLSNLPNIYNIDKFNFLRNAPQIYLQAISSFGKDDNIDSSIKFLKQIVRGQERIDKIHSLESEVNEKNPGLRRSLADMRDTTRNQFDIISKMHKFYENKERLTKVIENFKNSTQGINTREFRKFKNYISRIIQSDTFKTKSTQVFEYLHLHTANSELQGKILELSLSNENITPDLGEDTVRSNYQHLPILIFYKQQSLLKKSSWHDLLKTISNYLSEPGQDEKNEFITSYNNIIENLKKKKGFSAIEISIILYYLSLILPDPDSNVGNEKQLIRQLENLKEVIKYSYIKQVYNPKNEEFEEILAKNKYEIEINYMLIWIYRRKKMFDKSIELANKVLEIYSDEPRIIHGKALSILSKAYSQESGYNISRSLLKAKNLLIKSLRLYEYEKVTNNILLRKTLIAISNSICNLYNHLYNHDKKEEYLENSKKSSIVFLDIFKRYISKPIEDFPAFCDTLCWLNLNIAEAELDNSNHDEATKRYTTAQHYFDICKVSKIYDNFPDQDYFNNLKSKLNTVKKEVIKKDS
ncbi:tetratricopeptide repeat protein [Flavivirga eckloniae]|uniref:Tetratricopeptide repeat protein n=1 Tax=Flavivirga eckloniae TaxID=1803846 RepID=A0A2K9PR31_9FLAO|nr:hypothetical protein [Flavivirga eckloniae]AUP79511.1 hypothetical protein C1H87_12660 [Flavivirga eckloniae]